MSSRFDLGYIEELGPESRGWKVEGTLLSAYDGSDRVDAIHANTQAERTVTLLPREYGIEEAEVPREAVLMPPGDEAESLLGALEGLGWLEWNGLAVDISGFPRPHLLFLLVLAKRAGVERLPCFYAEPILYDRRGETVFIPPDDLAIRQVRGYEGPHSGDPDSDMLVIGSGYDHALLAEVADAKENARKIQMLGFPSLAADMYQENVLRSYQARESLGSADEVFAPANDPFVTAAVLEVICRDSPPGTNAYLCPLGTKVQCVGFGFYFLQREMQRSTSLVLPIAKRYATSTSRGVGRMWRYELDFRL